MREDMAKVIVERPRRGGYSRCKGRLGKDLEAQPIKQGMKYRLADNKSLNENLAPLRRYLARQVGRPWARVYSEISANLKATNAVQQHVRDHLKDYVAVKMSVNKAGEPMVASRWRRSYDFYVDPQDGILKRAKADTDKARKRAKEQRRQRIAVAQSKVNNIQLAPGSDLRRLNGIWFAVNYSRSPDGSEIIKQKRQLSTKELRQRNLLNQAVCPAIIYRKSPIGIDLRARAR
ncbi:MAG: hypothetical protein EXR70_08670 [Deltaproteobacteria bacterium]|nr:hypothetical protein [Deltaproteobacteria bacterium]